MWYPSTTSQLGEADLGVIGVLGALGFPAVTLGRTPETMQISVVGGASQSLGLFFGRLTDSKSQSLHLP